MLGFARQGQALARWLPRVGASVVVSDSRSESEIDIDRAAYPNVEFVLGGHPEDMLDGVDLLCLSGGVPLDLPIVQHAVNLGIPLSNDAQLFLERCPAPVIGITGSAGKTTTTTLVGNILRHAGHRVYIGGNIGSVLLDVLSAITPDSYVVMELSSFQLELMTISPHLAAVLNITPNHLDRHGDMESYIAAKANILAYQKPGDIAVLGRDDAGSYQLEALLPGGVIWFSQREIIPDGAFMAGERLLVVGGSSPDGVPHTICERSEIRLRGDHNVSNVLAACAITGAVGVPPETIALAVKSFTGVPHRLETVREVGGVMYVNDSIATAPERVVAALRSYDEPLILLLGGRDKKLPWEEMLLEALRKSRHIITFGEAGDMIADIARKLSYSRRDDVHRVKTLPEAVTLAATVAHPGDVVLLSPGCTSYDAYTDFVERGLHFRRLVEAL